jgi:caa(3)-type oxidase subunit IV
MVNESHSPANQSHPQTNYFLIFGMLLVAFAASLGLSILAPTALNITLIFLIASFKAWLVAMYFIHLKAEPRFVKVVVICILVLLAVLYAGLLPDIVLVHGRMRS